MKKKILILEVGVLIFFIIVFTIPVQADPSIMVSDYELSPKVFMSGDYGILKLTIKNAETSNTVARTTTSGSTSTVYTDSVGVSFNNIWIASASDSNGKKVKAKLNYEDVGDLSPSTSFDITFEIIAEDGISEGLYFPIVRIDVETYTDVSFPIPIKVSNSSIDLISKDIPSQISQSGSTDIILTVMNDRENSVKNVRIFPKALNGIEIRPEIVIIENLDANSLEDVTFSIIPNEIGEKELIFDVSYDNGENEHTSSSHFTIDIVDKQDVSTIIYGIPSEIEIGREETVKLKVYNSKTEDISSVIVSPISDAKIIPSKYFIGAMDADDIYSLSFDVDTTGLIINETYDIGFMVYFKQDGTTFETPSITSSFKVISNNENDNEGAIFFGIFITIIIIFAFLGFRYHKKKSMKKLLSKQE